MRFEQAITEITFTLEKRGFSIVEDRTNCIKFQTGLVTLIFSYSPLEHVFSVFVGKSNSELNELTNNVCLNVFGTTIQEMSGETFAEKFIHFLQNDGSAIMTNDIAKMNELEAYCKKAAKEFTAGILNKQNLEAADRAWDKKNYQDFINHLNKVDEKTLSNSYGLKRKIALRKIEEGN